MGIGSAAGRAFADVLRIAYGGKRPSSHLLCSGISSEIVGSTSAALVLNAAGSSVPASNEPVAINPPIQREAGSDFQRFRLGMSFVNFFARKLGTCILFRMPCTIATISSTVR
jgi:hypothetical protein